ncbi:MAG: hydrogen gas-evolving membrane-bound hydrogenase subunit E [Devosia sp.]
MALDFDAFAIGLLLAPFAMALLAPLISQETGRAAGWIIAIVPAGLFVALLSLLGPVASGKIVQFAVDWVQTLGLEFALRIDGLSLVFALLISGIGSVVAVCSASFLDGHAHRGRFMAFLMLFMGAMLGLVLADSLPALFAFWELTSVASFLLIGFDHHRVDARRAATQALVVTGLGGLCLMIGGVLLHAAAGTWNLSGLPSLAADPAAASVYPAIVVFVLLAAFTKSAQVPFHFWLPGAMEAPTPVSAYLHSATMVQAGVYLLARLSPVLSGTPLWQVPLLVVGGVTLLWGAIHALGQTDLKYVLAQSTIAALGLSVFLIGIGGETGALALAAFFVAHALYKAGLFLVVGILDRSTGSRDIRMLGGLRELMPISFLATAAAALSMFGLPPFLGWFAKEELYLAATGGGQLAWAALGVLVVGSALMGAAALVVLVRPFMGSLGSVGTPRSEGGISLWAGPVVLGLAGFSAIFLLTEVGQFVIGPMAAAIAGGAEPHMSTTIDVFGIPFWASLATWALAITAYRRVEWIRAYLGEAAGRAGNWTFDRGFDQAMFGLVRAGGGLVRLFQHGRLELYLVLLFALLAIALVLPLLGVGDWPAFAVPIDLTPMEWGAVALIVVGTALVVAGRTRLGAIVALGLQGLGTGLLFLFMGAPDLGFTQLMIEVVSVVILALVMTRLRLGSRDPRPLEDWLRDGALALVCGSALAALLIRITAEPLDRRLSDFFASSSAALAHGRNIVNVILVDFRGLDTLGEITVVMTGGIAILALLGGARRVKRAAGPAVDGGGS